MTEELKSDMGLDVLERAKKVQKRVAVNATFWISLDLLEAMIAEIEQLRTLKRFPGPKSVAKVRARAEERREGDHAS